MYKKCIMYTQDVQRVKKLYLPLTDKKNQQLKQ